MKKLLIALSLMTAACSGSSITGPTVISGQPVPSPGPAASSDVPTASGAAGSSSGQGPAAPANGSAATPQFVVDGPTGCVRAGSDILRWVVDVSDAGPSPLRFVALAHNAVDPGCAHTTDNPRARVELSGVADYASHAAGRTTFTFDPRSFTCGRSQVDVSIFDAQGQEILIVGMVVDYGTACPPPPPAPPANPSLRCAPRTQAVGVNDPVALTATGGTGVYEWNGGGKPGRGQSASFSTVFSESGHYAVTVTSGDATATCDVDVAAPPPPPDDPLLCLPATQTVGVSETAALTATGGQGGFSWSGGAVPATGVGATFSTAYAFPGTYPVTVSSGSAKATCEVVVTKPSTPFVPLQCTPGVQFAKVNEPVVLTAAGGTGTYAWSGGGSPAVGAGETFTTTFGTAGHRSVRLTSGELGVSCEVTVTEPPPPPPPTMGGEGCTPGYWRQWHHYDSWNGYSPDTLFGAVFENAFEGKTLGQVVRLEGGGLNALGRHAVAALLNAASPTLHFDLSVSEVIQRFNHAYPGGNYEALKEVFARFNDQKCPLD
ncbi:MAG: hypothetical protein AB7N65_20965 [Vicinamibacterales bacterium]